jgi:hypothetical protein
MQLLKQSTTATVTVGPMLDADGVAVTTAVLADFSISKNGSVAVLTGATVTHSTNGYYTIALTTGNVDSLGRLDIIVNNSAMSMSNHRYDVLPSDTYEELMTTGIADAVWDEPYAGHTTAGSFGKLIDLLRKANMVVEGTVLASPTPTTTTFNVSGLNYPTGAFEHAVLFFADDSTLAEQNSPILTFVNNGNGTQTIVLEEARTAAPVAGDTILIDATSHVHAIADIQAGLATTTQLTTVESKIDTLDNYVDTEVAAIKAKTDNLPSDPADASDITAAFTEIKGAGWSSSTDTLEKISDAAGGTNVTIMPLSATATARVSGTTITTFIGDRSALTIAVFDSSGAAVDLTAQGTLEVVIERRDGTDLQVIPAASLTIGGVSNNQLTFSPDATAVGTLGQHLWALRKTSNEGVLAHGNFVVSVAAFDN